jgi:DNA repair protein RecO (recombination protein O)
MDWQDQGFVLAARRHGESDAILTLLTREHGRHLGIVKGGSGKRHRAVVEIGNRLTADWHARLSEHLGRFQVELSAPHAAMVLSDPPRLAALSAACATLDAALPEREPHPEIFDDFAELAAALSDAKAGWPGDFVRWEGRVLGALGFGLDLRHCAVTGETEGLAYVSPKTGRAVTAEAGRLHRDKLLPLPAFLLETDVAPPRDDLIAGLRLTGYFLDRHVFAHAPKHGAADARARLIERLAGWTQAARK